MTYKDRDEFNYLYQYGDYMTLRWESWVILPQFSSNPMSQLFCVQNITHSDRETHDSTIFTTHSRSLTRRLKPAVHRQAQPSCSHHHPSRRQTQSQGTDSVVTIWFCKSSSNSQIFLIS